MKRKRKCLRNTCILLLGILLSSFGLLILLNFNTIYEMIIKNALIFTPNSKAYNAWKINDPPLIMDIYLFNWTNPEDLYDKSIKPRFQEVGPFRFRETKEKINVTWNDNKTVTYKQMKLFYFHEESPMKLTEEITTINAVALVCVWIEINQYLWC